MKNKIILIIAFFAGFTGLKAQHLIPKATISVEEGVTNLRWITEGEVNSSYFIIEELDSHGAFKTFASIKASGYSLTKNEYSIELTGEHPAHNHYRVTLVTMDGERLKSLAVHSQITGDEQVMAGK